MSINIVNTEPMDGRAWTIMDPTMEGMGWHIVRVDEDGHTMTTMAVADSEDEAVAYIYEQMDVTAMTEVGEEAIAEMVAVKCVACAHVVTDKAVMARMWCVDTCCPACGDGALLWDDGSLGYSV